MLLSMQILFAIRPKYLKISQKHTFKHACNTSKYLLLKFLFIDHNMDNEEKLSCDL
jgi:hypothetical protein